MAYDKKSVLKNERPYDVMRKIGLSKKGSYSSKIAEELDTGQQLVSEIIQLLCKHGLLEKGPRTQAQYYKIDHQGCLEFFLERVKSEVGDELYDTYADLYDAFDENKSIEEKLESEMSDFYRYYVYSYFMNVEDSTVEEFLIYDFFEGVDKGVYDREFIDNPEWVDFIIEVKRIGDFEISSPEAVVVQAWSEYSDDYPGEDFLIERDNLDLDSEDSDQ